MPGFKLGTLILISKPYACVLNNKVRGERCDFCFKKAVSLKRCSGCSFTFYCNKSCQVNGWKDSHKMECKFLRSNSSTDPDVRLLSLIILKLKTCGPDEPCEEVLGRKVTFGTLMSHSEEIKQSFKSFNTAKLLMDSVTEFIGEENMPPPDEFIEIFGKMSINYITISDAIRGIGSGLYLGGSVFDHSCDPNAEFVSEGRNMLIRAKKYIPKKEINQVRVTYTDQIQLTKIRQDLLMTQYFFLCQCNRCVTSAFEKEMTKVLSDGEEYLAEVNKKLNILEGLKEMKISSSPMHDACIKKLENLDKDRKLADTHVSRVKMVKELYDAAMMTGNHNKALEYGLQLLKPYRLYLGPYHSILGFHLYEVSNLQIEEGKITQAIVNRAEAKKILKVTIGENHPLFHRLFEVSEK